MFYLYHPGTEMINHPHIMRNHHNSNPRLDLFGNKQASLFLKLIISGYKNLIYQQNFRMQIICNGKAESRPHSSRIHLNGLIYKIAQSREINNIFHLPDNFSARHLQLNTFKHNILTTRQTIFKTRTEGKNTDIVISPPNFPIIRLKNTGE